MFTAWSEQIYAHSCNRILKTYVENNIFFKKKHEKTNPMNNNAFKQTYSQLSQNKNLNS